MLRLYLCLGLILSPSLSFASQIERACLRADRPSATVSLCGCIQSAADVTLSSADQRKAARFFKDPHRAQEIQQSDRARDEAFWIRYRSFTATAERACS